MRGFSATHHPSVAAAMPTQFADLPTEIRLQIFDLAAIWQCRPQAIEIFEKDGIVYSKTPPPALLHVNHESRDVILKKYKPWLPRFKGTAAFKPFTAMVDKMGVDKVSHLQNVYINLEDDTLLIENPIRNLGPLECYNLRTLRIDVEGDGEYDRNPRLNQCLRRFKNLKTLQVYDSGHKHAALWKVRRIMQYISKEHEREVKKPKKRIPRFAPPSVIDDTLGKFSRPIYEDSFNRDNWVTYKYPGGDHTKLSSGKGSCPSTRITRSTKRIPDPEQRSRHKRPKASAELLYCSACAGDEDQRLEE